MANATQPSQAPQIRSRPPRTRTPSRLDTTSPGWAYAASIWLVSSTLWHAQMAITTPDGPLPGSPAPYWMFLTYDCLIIFMSAYGTAAVLATVRPWQRRTPLWLIRGPLRIGCVLLGVRGVLGMGEDLAVVSGIEHMGSSAGDGRVLGMSSYLSGLSINAYFFLGAVLLIPATRAFTRKLPASS